MTQSFTAIAGTYNVSFIAANRPFAAGGAGGVQPVTVSLDGTVVGTVSTSSVSFINYTTPNFALTTGVHTLALAATDKLTDKTTFIDTVAINVASCPILLAH